MKLNVLDYAIIAILLLSALAGFRRGLFNVIAGLMGILIGLLAAVIFHRELALYLDCLLYTSQSPRDRTRPRMPSSA